MGKIKKSPSPKTLRIYIYEAMRPPDNEILLHPGEKVLTVFNRDLAYEFNIDS